MTSNSVSGKILTTIRDASVFPCTNRVPVCIHPLLAVHPEFNAFISEDQGHMSNICTYRMVCPFTMIGELEPLRISRLIHLLTLVILDLKHKNHNCLSAETFTSFTVLHWTLRCWYANKMVHHYTAYSNSEPFQLFRRRKDTVCFASNWCNACLQLVTN